MANVIVVTGHNDIFEVSSSERSLDFLIWRTFTVLQSFLSKVYRMRATLKEGRKNEARVQAWPQDCDASLSREEVVQVLSASYQSFKERAESPSVPSSYTNSQSQRPSSLQRYIQEPKHQNHKGFTLLSHPPQFLKKKKNVLQGDSKF